MRAIKSFSYAWRGIETCYKGERNYRVQIFISLPVLCAGLYFNLPGAEWIVILFSIGLTLSLEMINSSIEKLADHVTPGLHPAIKQIKDIAAGAVLLSAIVNCIISAIIFIPHLKHII